MATTRFPLSTRRPDVADAALAGAAAGAALSLPTHLQRGLVALAVALLGALAVVVALWVAWRRSRGGPGRAAGLTFAVATLVATLLADTVNAMPLAIVGICVLTLEWGRRAGFTAIVAVAAVMCALGLILRHGPLGGLVVNLVLVALFLLLGIAAANLARQLDRALTDAQALAAQRRRAALADFDRILAEDRMSHARALHDDLGHKLTLVGMELTLAERLRERDPDAAWAQVARGRGQAAEALAALRRQVRALSPGTQADLAPERIDAALDDLGRTFRGTGLDVVVERSGDRQADELAYRIIQEGLTNVVRHSNARRVRVSLRSDANTRVEIADDGGGQRAPGEGFGLRHLRDRVESAGGHFEAGSTDPGFFLTAEYPAPEEP